jgi:dolichyl-phosphate beta-glucosyltransferase
VADTQCGLKLFSRRAAQEIFSRATIDGFAFDAEVVFLTRRLRLPFLRIPVNLIHEYASTLSLRRHALPMLWDVVWLRLRDWLAGKPSYTLAPLHDEAAAEQEGQRKLAA